ncbi:hypothetical protein ACP4OV_018439 [Aristida adscensionis]
MMGRSGRKKAKAKGKGAMDRISGLPDELLHHVMSFLPARDAVRTCVLSPRWRHLWESVRRLNVDSEGFANDEYLVEFANALLLSRGCMPLDSFWFRANGPDSFLENFGADALQWIRHALRSNVQELGIIDHDQHDTSGMDVRHEWYIRHEWFDLNDYNCPFTSSHLKRLHLCYVQVQNDTMEKLLSRCPALEDLEMINCKLDATELSSATLKNLTIDYVGFPKLKYEDLNDIVIDMPNLISLRIGSLLCPKPILVDVRSLVTASISLRHHDQYVSFVDACDIVGALSTVKNLELLFPCNVVSDIPCKLQSDMLLCQVVFPNMKTLSLSDWCLRDNCRALLYLLGHSPNLQRLTVKMAKLVANVAAEIDTPCEETVTPFNCERLGKIEIFCPKGDKRVVTLVKILYANIISPPPKIIITPSSRELDWNEKKSSGGV